MAQPRQARGGQRVAKLEEGRRLLHGSGGGRSREQVPTGLTIRAKGRGPLYVAHKNSPPRDTPPSSNAQQPANLCWGDCPVVGNGETSRNGSWNGMGGQVEQEASRREHSGDGVQESGPGPGSANGFANLLKTQHAGTFPGRCGPAGSTQSHKLGQSMSWLKYNLAGTPSPRNGANPAAVSGMGKLGQRTQIRSMGQVEPSRQPTTRPMVGVHQVPHTVPVHDGNPKDPLTPRGARSKGQTNTASNQSTGMPSWTIVRKNGKTGAANADQDGSAPRAAIPKRTSTASRTPTVAQPALLRPVQGALATPRAASMPSPLRHAWQSEVDSADRGMGMLQQRSAPVGGQRRVEQVHQPLGPKVISEPSERDFCRHSAPDLNGSGKPQIPTLRMDRKVSSMDNPKTAAPTGSPQCLACVSSVLSQPGKLDADNGSLPGCHLAGEGSLHLQGPGAYRDASNGFPDRVEQQPKFSPIAAQLWSRQQTDTSWGDELPVWDSEPNGHNSCSSTGTTASSLSLSGDEHGKKAGKRRSRNKSSRRGVRVASGIPGADFVDTPSPPPTAFHSGPGSVSALKRSANGYDADVGIGAAVPLGIVQRDVQSNGGASVRVRLQGSASAGFTGAGINMNAFVLGRAHTTGVGQLPFPGSYLQMPSTRFNAANGKENSHGSGVLFRRPQSPSVTAALMDLCSNDFSGSGTRYHERGFTNLGNTCFVGSAFQLLLGSSRFCWLLKQLSIVCHCLHPRALPTLVGLGELAKGMAERRGPNGGQITVQQGAPGSGVARSCKPMMPTMLSAVVNGFQQRHSQSADGGHCEEHDAQEFLLYLLEQVEVELVILKEAVADGDDGPGPRQGKQEESDWEAAGRKGKSSTKRPAGSQAETMLSAIFGGSVQSEVKASGMKPSVVVHRFTALDLDIAPSTVQTIEDAVQLYTEPDHLTDYKPTDSSQPQRATKANRLRDLPEVLLVSLKRYAYTAEGLQKIDKPIAFGAVLSMQRQWLADTKPSRVGYRLVATCSHHGKGYGGDHYTANVLQPVGVWLNFNDSLISQLAWRDVADDAPYMLLYEKMPK